MPTELILLVRRHAQIGPGHRLDVLRPSPPRLHGDPAYLRATGEVEQFQSPVVTLTYLVRIGERHVLQRLNTRHDYSLLHPRTPQTPACERTTTTEAQQARSDGLPVQPPIQSEGGKCTPKWESNQPP